MPNRQTLQPGGQGRTPNLEQAVDGVLPALQADLIALSAIPSIAFPGFPAEPMVQAHDLVVSILRRAGFADIESIDLGDAAPSVLARIPAPEPTAPTVLLYSHYDVQPPGPDDSWISPAFEPTRFDSEHGPAIRGRGIVDDKSNFVAQVGALSLFDGPPPVGVIVLVDSGEEYGNRLDAYVDAHREKFACDAIVIADVGNIRPGLPTLTTSLRGAADLLVEVRTLKTAKHSGTAGGAAPDALLALIRALDTLHDEAGDVAVPGLRREEWSGESLTEEEFRSAADVLPDLPLLGTGTLGERLWSGPSVTVTGLDAPTVDDAPSAVVPYARARIGIRCHPNQDASEAQQIVAEHLRSLRPFGLEPHVTKEYAGSGFRATTDGPAYTAARVSLGESYDAETVEAASGGSVPLVEVLSKAAPGAEVLLFGCQDNLSNQHAPNERVLISEFRNTVIAFARFFTLLRAFWPQEARWIEPDRPDGGRAHPARHPSHR